MRRTVVVATIGVLMLTACSNNAMDDDATDANATDANATDANATDANATDANATDANATDANATDANATDANATDANATDANATDANATDANATDVLTTEGTGLGPDIDLKTPEKASNAWTIWASVRAADSSGISISGVKKGDTVTLDYIHGVGYFDVSEIPSFYYVHRIRNKSYRDRTSGSPWRFAE